MEEIGLIVLKKTMQPYGLIKLKAKESQEDLFVQDNYCYFCQVDSIMGDTRQEIYEKNEDFETLWVVLQVAINTNVLINHKGKDSKLSRAMMLLEILLVEGYFG